MAVLKRNHTPQVKNCVCNLCQGKANAPPGKPHRKCKQRPRGIWR